MKFILFISQLVAVVLASRKKQSRGKKIFGSDANPMKPIADAECTCATESNCWLVGDPHLKSFYNQYDQVNAPPGGYLEIYNHEDFNIKATTYGKDWMDNIIFGSVHAYHIDDCNGRAGFLPEKSHTYKDGSKITARVYCKKKGKKMHINLLLKKTVSLDSVMSFQDWETIIGSTGACVT